MHTFGFKIVDKPAEELDDILDYALDHGHPVEVGLYFNDAATLAHLRTRLSGARIPVLAHTRHNDYHALNLGKPEAQAALATHIELAQSLGSRYSVLHPSAYPLPQRHGIRQETIALLLDNLSAANALCARHGYQLHLENVFHRLDFYRDLFTGIRQRGLTHIHCCFDIGHARVWSAESLDEWFAFLDELHTAGTVLHMHLHANRGINDEHLSLQEAERLDIRADDDYNPYGYPGAYVEAQRRFPQALKVFEVKPDYALPNLQRALAALSSLP